MPKVILTIDDEEGFTNIMHSFFTQHGFKVLVAASGEEGLSVIRQQRPDVVLVDINMPGIDGVSAAERMPKDLPRVFISAEPWLAPPEVPVFHKPVPSLLALLATVKSITGSQ